MRFSVLLAGLATSLAFSSPVLADNLSDLDQCKFVGEISKADQGIAACGRIIGDAKVAGSGRAVAFSNRCGWWWAKKDPDRALSDCNEAIRVASSYAPAYINRGNAYLSKGDFEHAFGDFNEAIRLDPNYAKAYFIRGRLSYMKGSNPGAIDDYNRVIQLDAGDSFAYFNRG